MEHNLFIKFFLIVIIWITFGFICSYVGIWMVMMQTKMALCHVLRNFRLTPSPDTLIPMKFVNSQVPVMDPEKVFVNCTKIE